MSLFARSLLRLAALQPARRPTATTWSVVTGHKVSSSAWLSVPSDLPGQAVAAGLSGDLAGRACALPCFLPGWWRRPFCSSSSSSCSSWLERSVRSGLGGESPRAGFGAFSSVPNRCPEPPSPSSPPLPLPSPALPLVPGSLRRTHHDGRRRTAPDSVSTRDRGCQAPRGPGTAGHKGRELETGPKPGLLAALWPEWRGREALSSLSPFPWQGSPPFPQTLSLPGVWGLSRPFSLAPFFVHPS